MNKACIHLCFIFLDNMLALFEEHWTVNVATPMENKRTKRFVMF